MKREEFLEKIIQAVGIEEEVNEDSILEDVEEWDSLATITILALYKKHLGLAVPPKSILNSKKMSEILDLGNDKYEQ